MTVSRLAAVALTSAGLLLLPAQVALSAAAPAKAAAPATPKSAEPAVEPDALKALRDMGAFLRTLTSFEITASTVREEVDDAGQKLQFTGTTTYKVRRPNGFVIRVAEDRTIRELYYDGSSLILFAPRMGFYAKVAAPGTIHETVDFIADRYNIRVPLADLFKWGQGGDDGLSKLTRGYYVGYAKINGQEADQFAFRQQGVDWQIWIARGDKPVPLRVVITGAEAPHPQFEADLNWNLSPSYTDASFVFQPPPDAKLITIASGQ